MNKVFNLTFASSLTDLCEVNSSFDTGILRIAYTGKNRNNSYISKETFEKCIKTIYNCPIVCNYNRDENTIGGHDIEIVRDDSGDMRIVNLTTPVGCIPESAKVFWETVEEDDGTSHEYLCAEALLWKRQDAYRKIKRDGVESQSMEITVKDGESKDGVYVIYDFEFTAFTLIGVEPCFESACLEFSKYDFKQQLSQMMLEIKESFSQKVTPSEEADIHPQNYSTEGGEEVLTEEIDMVEISEDNRSDNAECETECTDVEFANNEVDEVADADAIGAVDDESADIDYALESNTRDEIQRVLGEVKRDCEWGECRRYWFVDYDNETGEVYCWDSEDWLLYGFKYIVDGDAVTIDFETKKRKKYLIVDFDEGTQQSPIAQIFEALEKKIRDNTESEAKYQKASDTILDMSAELEELRKYKADIESAAEASKKNEVLGRFADLEGIEAFEAIKASASDYDIDTLEEKCFAIRGRNKQITYSYNDTIGAKLPIERSYFSKDEMDSEQEPYGGVVKKYSK